MGAEPFLIASVLEGVLAQRLVRIICPGCRTPYEPEPKELRAVGIEGVPAGATLYRGKGCTDCRGTGYRGRTGIYEFLPMTEEMRSLTLRKAPGHELRQRAIADRHDDPPAGRLEQVLRGRQHHRRGAPRDPRGVRGVMGDAPGRAHRPGPLMPVFSYKAADRAGRTIDGVMEAHDPQAVIERLHRDEYFPVRVEPADGRPRLGALTLGGRRPAARPRPRSPDLTQQLSTLIDAGIPLDRALTILADLSVSARLRQIVQDVAQSVRTGSTLADALSKHHPRPFSRLYINTVRAGEKGGVLEAALRRLAEHLEQTRELRDALTSAMVYPILLISVGIGAVVFLMTFVLPRFAVIFADLGQGLPLPTRVLLAISGGMVDYWWVLALVVLGAHPRLAARRPLGSGPPGGRPLAPRPRRRRGPRAEDRGRAASRAPWGPCSGPGCRSWPRSASPGRSPETVCSALALGAVQDGAKRGDGLARPMAETGAFPPLAIHMVRVGEETGRIEDMLDRVAGTYEMEIRVAVRRFIALLEPVVILGLGLVVLGIVLSILLAILSINELPL